MFQQKYFFLFILKGLYQFYRRQGQGQALGKNSIRTWQKVSFLIIVVLVKFKGFSDLQPDAGTASGFKEENLKKSRTAVSFYLINISFNFSMKMKLVNLMKYILGEIALYSPRYQTGASSQQTRAQGSARVFVIFSQILKPNFYRPLTGLFDALTEFSSVFL